MKQEDFDRICLENLEEVKTWAKWKQKIVINAENASTGQFLMSEEEWQERQKQCIKIIL